PALLMNRGHELAFATLQGIITAAESQGASLLPVTAKENIVLDELARESSGLVLFDHNYDIDGFGGVAAFALARGRPVCVAGPTSSDIPGVSGDHQEAFELATDHLLGLGHSRIALINHVGRNGSEKRVAEANQQGYLKAFRKRRLAHPPDLYAETAAHERPQFRAETAAALDRFLEQRPRLTAIVCNNDPRAFLVMELLAERGLRVPQDVSIVGFDNRRQSAQCSPPLTTVDPRRFAQGEAAVHYVIHRLRGGAGAPPCIRPRLIVRESTGPVNQS
ncbi:MAG TPA: LacI family DNA-binding transcriptional regulator, partial [Candidatus Brocadiia bacterium]|nr:LacI family DNA-binding transcriptional regulator [Candidatus Brocadiia bacterium]